MPHYCHHSLPATSTTPAGIGALLLLPPLCYSSSSSSSDHHSASTATTIPLILLSHHCDFTTAPAATTLPLPGQHYSVTTAKATLVPPLCCCKSTAAAAPPAPPPPPAPGKSQSLFLQRSPDGLAGNALRGPVSSLWPHHRPSPRVCLLLGHCCPARHSPTPPPLLLASGVGPPSAPCTLLPWCRCEHSCTRTGLGPWCFPELSAHS